MGRGTIDTTKMVKFGRQRSPSDSSISKLDKYFSQDALWKEVELLAAINKE